MKKISHLFLVTMIFAFAFPSDLRAKPCEDDAKKFCADIQPGGGRILNCLRDHSQDISQDCYKALDQIKSKGQGASSGEPGEKSPQGAINASCVNDVKQFCSEVKPGGGRIKSCLQDHYKEISQACYGVLSSTSPGDSK